MLNYKVYHITNDVLFKGMGLGDEEAKHIATGMRVSTLVVDWLLSHYTPHTLCGMACFFVSTRWSKTTKISPSLGNTFLFRFKIVLQDHTKREITLLL